MITSTYNPFDVYNFAADGNIDELLEALNYDDNLSYMYVNDVGSTALHIAANNGHGTCVEILLDSGFNINIKDYDGFTALHRAAQEGHFNVVNILLERGIDINIKTNDDGTALHDASCYGHLDVVEILLDNGIDIDSKIKIGGTALILAVCEGHLEVVKMLIMRGSDINKKGRYGMTALNYAARYGYIKIVDLLLDNGIDINGKNLDCENALYHAARHGHINIAEKLLERGIDIYSYNDNSDCEIIDDIDMYSTLDEEEVDDGRDESEIIDCRRIILAEIEHRHKRAVFDLFINHYIEYQPYVNNIYTRCYPTGNLKVAKPPIGWIIAEEIRNKYYFDEVLFILHLHVANFYTNQQPGAIMTTSSLNSINYLANNSDRTSTLMTVLSDRLMMFLKPEYINEIDVNNDD